MKRFLLPMLVLFVLLCLPANGEGGKEAQGANETTNELKLDQEVAELFDEHVAAIKQSKFKTLSRQVHPGEAEAFKAQFLALANATLDHGDFGKFARMYPWVNSIKQIENTEPAEVMANMMESTLGSDLGFRMAMKKATITRLGYVSEEVAEEEGDAGLRIHVVYRLVMRVQGNEVDTIEVISMRRGDDGRLYLQVDAKTKAVVNSLLNHYKKLG